MLGSTRSRSWLHSDEGPRLGAGEVWLSLGRRRRVAAFKACPSSGGLVRPPANGLARPHSPWLAWLQSPRPAPESTRSRSWLLSDECPRPSRGGDRKRVRLRKLIFPNPPRLRTHKQTELAGGNRADKGLASKPTACSGVHSLTLVATFRRIPKAFPWRDRKRVRLGLP